MKGKHLTESQCALAIQFTIKTSTVTTIVFVFLYFVLLYLCIPVRYSNVHTSAFEIPESENMILGFEISLQSGLQAMMNVLPVWAVAILIHEFQLGVA